MSDRLVTVKINMKQSDLRRAKALAALRGTTITQVIREAIMNEDFLQRRIFDSSATLFALHNNRMNEIIFPSMHTDRSDDII
jgi:hypothetical protein